MKQIWKKGISLLLAFSMAAGLSACGGNETSEVSTAAKEHVFRSEDIALDANIDLSDVQSVCCLGDRLYFYAMTYSDMGQEEFLLSVALDGSDVKTIPLTISQSSGGGAVIMPRMEAVEDLVESPVEIETEEAESDIADETEETEQDITDEEKYPDDMPAVSLNSYVTTMATDGKLLYFVVDEYYNDYSDENNPIYEETYTLKAFDTEGQELWKQELGKNSNDSMSYFYVSSVVGTPEGVLCNTQTDSESLYILFDSEGARKDQFTLEGADAGSLYVNSKGDVFLQYWGDVNGNWQQKIQKLDLQTKTLSEPMDIPGMNSYNLSICSSMYGGQYDLYLYDSMAVYGYHMGDSDKTEILNFIDSDIDNSYMNYLMILSDTEMMISGVDYSSVSGDYPGFLCRLTKVDPADVKEKTVLQLACYGNLYEIRSRVIHFNKTNPDYRIQITDYSSYNEEGDWDAGINRLNNDIVSGNVPDILYLNSNMPVSSYISKGLFADLYPFIDSDEELNREDFLENILEAFSVDGKLYQLVPSFSVSTLTAKTKFVGEEPGWTVDEMIALWDSMPEGTDLFSDIIRNDFLYSVLNQSGSQFIDWKSGKCHFDSPEFIKLLEFCARLPEEYDFSKYEDEDYWLTADAVWRDDKVLLQSLYLNSFRQYQRAKYGTFGEDITMIGFPGAEGNGATIYYDLSIAMSAKSKHQEGAWEFMRQYLLDDYQNSVSYGWPVSLKRLETLKQEATQKPYWLNEKGEKVEYDDTYWIGEQEIVIPPSNQEEIDAVMEILTTVTQVGNYDEDLNNIVYEEAEAFFSGQKSAQEVAGIIQSRAGIYVSENR